MTCQPFTITLNRDINSVLTEVSRKAAEMGISFQGDSTSGELSGMGLYATYSVYGNQVTIKIDSLPILYSCAGAERKIREYFEG